MHHWNDIRRGARKRHRDLLQVTNGDRSAVALLAAAERATGFRRRGVEADNPLLDGGEAKLDRERNVVWYNADVSQETQWFYQAHEFAHAWLETGGYGCLAQEIDEGASEDKGQIGGISRIEGYNPRERDEREANVFAREFLLPTDALRAWTGEGLTASDIASRVGVSLSMVLHQLSRGLLVAESLGDQEPDDGDQERDHASDLELDDSQQEAADAEGPVLVVAGPGTGKTRTLTGRTVRLVQKGVDPERILALTFSNRAAEEMRSRLGRVLPGEAHRIWMGTFHAFGLELLLKHNERAGLPIAPRVLDPVDASMLLEGVIVDLDLYHYRNLPDPGLHIPKILGAISRAKDEVVGPSGYAQLADRMRAAATTDDEIERAEKAQEVARVYVVYQELLAREGALDFGDLISRTVLMLEDEAHADLRRDLQDAYPHVLVDEYQDVNRASARLLKAIAGDGAGLWVVGDPRQAIYRWRGASTENVKRFGKDYPGAPPPKQLKVNYRSRPRIVSTVAELAPKMKASPAEVFEPWDANRDEEPGEVRMEVAPTMEAEGLGLARLIGDWHEAGVAYRDQAVLCRSHTLLERYARLLEREGVPVLYLGDVFERPEVRDMLALVSLTCDGGWNGLVRVATFPEYCIPLDDVERVIEWAREEKRYPLSSLSEAAQVEGMSPEGTRGLILLRDHLDGVHPNVPTWDLLARHLFERSRYLDLLEADNEVEAQQKRLALYQLLALAHGHREREGTVPNHPRRSFLHYVRRLAKQSEDRQIRQVPEWADDIDAVRLLTVHASKGLEFEAVYVPALAKTYFPSIDRRSPCPPPDGLIDAALSDVHDEEEECLFFVAISRARDALCLSRAARYLKTNRDPSVLLPLVAARLSYPYDGGATWEDEPPAADSTILIIEEHDLSEGPFTSTELGTYMTCPRRYYYERVLGLSSWAEPSPFLAFHRAVRRTIRGIIKDRAGGVAVDHDEVHRQLDEAWEGDVLAQSPYGRLFRSEADRMIEAVLAQPAEGFAGTVLRPEWTVSLDSGEVTIRPDAVRIVGDETVVERWKTGRLSKGEADKDEYALYHKAASEQFENYEVRAVLLADGEETPLPMTDAKRNNRLKKYDGAMGSVAAGRFHACPSDRECPVCPFYFICPA